MPFQEMHPREQVKWTWDYSNLFFKTQFSMFLKDTVIDNSTVKKEGNGMFLECFLVIKKKENNM